MSWRCSLLYIALKLAVLFRYVYILKNTIVFFKFCAVFFQLFGLPSLSLSHCPNCTVNCILFVYDNEKRLFLYRYCIRCCAIFVLQITFTIWSSLTTFNRLNKRTKRMTLQCLVGNWNSTTCNNRSLFPSSYQLVQQ